MSATDPVPWTIEAVLAEQGLDSDTASRTAADARSQAFGLIGGGCLDVALQHLRSGRPVPPKLSGIEGPGLAADPRRRDERYGFAHPVQIRADGWAELVELWMRDISHGGLFVHADRAPAHRDRVQIHIVVPDGTKIAIDGEVVYVVTREEADARGVDAGFGVAFVNVSPERRAQLERFVQHAAGRDQTGEAGAEPPPLEPGASSSFWRLSMSAVEARQVEEIRHQLLCMVDRSDAELLGVRDGEDQAATRRALLEVGEPWYRLGMDQRLAPESRALVLAVLERLEQAARRLAHGQGLVSPEVGSTTTYRWVAPRTGASRPAAAGQRTGSEMRGDGHDKADTSAGTAGPSSSSTPEGERPGPRAGRRTTPQGPTASPEAVATRRLSEAIELLRARKWEEALPMLEEVRASRPEDSQITILIRLTQARRCLQQGDPQGAAGHYEAILALDPNHAMARRELLVTLCMTS